MKNILISMVLVVIMLVTACQKNESINSNFNVDTKSYETKLSNDYTNALQYHNSLNVADADTAYFYKMFNTCDSLFSEHFYEFCIDMMQNSGMMSTSNGMMGNNSSMMNGTGGMMGGSGGMMNGNTMGSMADMNKMMNFMDSLHHSSKTMMNPDYMNTDSLMHNQMIQCNMMTSETDSIDILYGDMHTVRMNHQKMHGN
jgi:hypothetical protein